MCGIAGFVSSHELPVGRLGAMLRAVKHRGPDGEGVLALRRDGAGKLRVEAGAETAHVALGHARLAIVDLSDDAREPMGNEDGSLWLVFNGEIYNHASLRPGLEAHGHRFRSRCDAEVILHGFEEHGPPFFRRLQGMYAFALVDTKDGEVHLCRDAFGIKPLHYAIRDGTLAFASELRALDGAGFCGDVSADSLALYLSLGYLPHPASLLDGAGKVAPGVCLRFAGGKLKPVDQRARPALPHRRTGEPMSARHVEHIGSVVRESVRAHLMADVEVGAFLSGGIDSALVAAAMVDVHDGPVRAFTIAVDDPALDESEQAAAVARVLGVRHHVRRVGGAEAVARLPALLAGLDEPLADPSILPTRLCAELAREHVKVVLSGDGGDELFGGYTRHQLFGLLQRVRPVAPVASLLGEGAHRLVGEDRINRIYAPLARLVGLPALKAPARKLLAASRAAGELPALQYGRMFRAGQVDELAVLGMRGDPAAAHLLESGRDGGEALAIAQSIDLASWLPADILTKVDRATMAVGLEARVPLICDDVASAAAALPMPALRSGRVGKRVLRALAEQRFGAAMARRGKRGFGIPLRAWLDGPLSAWRRESIASLSERAVLGAGGLARLERAHDAGEDHSPLIFALCALEMWWRARPSGAR